jgi:hypothetical protein
MVSRSRRVMANRRSGVTVVAVAVALVGIGGVAAGLALTSSGSKVTAAAAAAPPSTSTAPSTTTMPPAAPVPTTTTTPAPTASAAADTSKLISDTCRYSHEANDDPILLPGRSGAAMAHDFFGNSTTSAISTAPGLVGGTTTCSTSDDASAYWTPVLYQNGQAITPTRNLIYWSGLHATAPTVSAPPVGLEMIAGDENARAPQSTKVVAWRCASPMLQLASATPVNCAGTNGLELRVTFPSCWDGTTLNGATQTNVAYPDGAHCPAGYPVRIPTVIFHVVYPITSDNGLTLSMGPDQQGSTDTAHGDFINGWNQDVLTGLIEGCAGSAHTCGHVTGAHAEVHPRL